MVAHKTALHWYERLAGHGVILAFTGKKMFYFTKNQGCLRKFKNQPWHLLSPTAVNFRPHCRNLSHETVPLMIQLQNVPAQSRNGIK
jgi:hypothetical protein